jgi:uncharacterized short protein YbdD (DUF466 family)
METWRETVRIMGRRLHRLWSRMREWCGDAAYERYLRSNARSSGTSRILNAQEFYLEQTTRRYSQPNRCC